MRLTNLWLIGRDLAIPIVPAVHGTDYLVAEKIAETGFANLSSLDAGFYGKVGPSCFTLANA